MAYAFDISSLYQHQKKFDDSPVQGYPFYQKLAPTIEELLTEAIDEAPSFTKFKEAGQRVIRTIHTVPELCDVDRYKVEFYLGRAGATPRHVWGRFSNHLKTKKHQGATIVLNCPTEKITLWESAAVRVLKILNDRKKLCVANIACSGAGRLPNAEQSVIYLTWRIIPRHKRLCPVTRSDIASIAENVAASLNNRLRKDTLTGSLDPITRPVREITDLEWALLL